MLFRCQFLSKCKRQRGTERELGNEGETTCQNFKSPLSHFRVVAGILSSATLVVISSLIKRWYWVQSPPIMLKRKKRLILTYWIALQDQHLKGPTHSLSALVRFWNVSASWRNSDSAERRGRGDSRREPALARDPRASSSCDDPSCTSFLVYLSFLLLLLLWGAI